MGRSDARTDVCSRPLPRRVDAGRRDGSRRAGVWCGCAGLPARTTAWPSRGGFDMIRLFVALPLPEDVTDSLLALEQGVPGARWSTREQLHLTLRFIGEVDGRDASAIDETLAAISAPPFTLQLKGVGAFGGKNPRALWAGVAANEALIHLQRKIESTIQRLGFHAEKRKYTPHVTLARLRATP